MGSKECTDTETKDIVYLPPEFSLDLAFLYALYDEPLLITFPFHISATMACSKFITIKNSKWYTKGTSMATNQRNFHRLMFLTSSSMLGATKASGSTVVSCVTGGISSKLSGMVAKDGSCWCLRYISRSFALG